MNVKDVDDALFAEVAPLLRRADKDEWRVASMVDLDHLDASTFKLPRGAGAFVRGAWDNQSRPLAVWGVSPLRMEVPWVDDLLDVGAVWLVATPAGVLRASDLMRHVMLDQLGEMLAMYDTLTCAVWDQNQKHIEWLDRIGFTVAGDRFVMPHSGGVFIPYNLGK